MPEQALHLLTFGHMSTFDRKMTSTPKSTCRLLRASEHRATSDSTEHCPVYVKKASRVCRPVPDEPQGNSPRRYCNIGESRQCCTSTANLNHVFIISAANFSAQRSYMNMRGGAITCSLSMRGGAMTCTGAITCSFVGGARWSTHCRASSAQVLYFWPWLSGRSP